MAVESILRPNVEALIPPETSPEIIKSAVAESTVLTKFRRLPNMSSNTKQMPVLGSLPMTYWVNGDTGTKKTASVSWENVKITAEELAVIVPIPEAVLDDAASNGYDIWGEIKPLIGQSVGSAIDGAVIFGTNKPTSWRDSIVAAATAAGRIVTDSGDLWDDIMGVDGVIAHVEKSGFLPTGVLSSVGMRGALRSLRGEDGHPIFKAGVQGKSAYDLDGMMMDFVLNGAWDDTKASLIVGDMSQAVYSIRQDITYKLLTESVIQDPATKEIVYNLAQQDMVALRVVMRLGWALPNPINALAPDKATRFPFAVLAPQAA